MKGKNTSNTTSIGSDSAGVVKGRIAEVKHHDATIEDIMGRKQVKSVSQEGLLRGIFLFSGSSRE